MPVLLSNISFDTSRRARNASTGVTAAAGTANLTGVIAHVDRMTQRQLAGIPETAWSAEYTAIVEARTDIAEGDFLLNLTELRNGLPWPNDLPSSVNVYWQVVHAAEDQAGLIPCRLVYFKRYVGAGPAHP